MKMPAFEPSRRRWDEFKQFHIQSGKFVDFESGECIWVHPAPDPCDRRMYSARQVQIVSTADSDCPDLFDPSTGEKLPTAWLTQGGQQMLAIDHEFNMAVGLRATNSGRSANLPQGIPTHLHSRAAVYWGGEGQKPVGRSQVHYNPPLVLTLEQKRGVSALRDQCQVWMTMLDINVNAWSDSVVVDCTPHKVPKGQPLITAVLDKTIADLTIPQRLQLLRHGHAAERRFVKLTHFSTVKS